MPSEIENEQTPPVDESGEQTEAQTPTEPELSEEDQLRQQCEELQDKNLRLAAELRNTRQRGEREKTEALRYAESDFARELLIVLDDFERTMSSAEATTDVKALADGVRIIYEHFQKVLRSREIEPIEAVGKPFDPTYHEAMLQQPSGEHASGVVMQELARGYKMHGRVIRPTRVIVSSGPSAAAEESEE